MATTTPTMRRPGTVPGDTDDVLARARTHAIDRPQSYFTRLIATDGGIAPAIARLGLGLVMLPHALQKLLGWFGGFGLSATYSAFTRHVGLPGPLAFFAIAAEIFGAFMLVFGVFTRVASLLIIAVMLGAIATSHWSSGFFMNWNGTQHGEGFEYHLLAIALGLVCLAAGGGRWSVDRAMGGRRPAEGGSIATL